jgi:hypothetical protein
MFKLPDAPSPRAGTSELADFVEWSAWREGTVSIRDVLAALGRMEDNEYNIGCDDDEDETANLLDEVFNEIERRSSSCGNGYPFTLHRSGTVLKCFEEDHNPRGDVYRYLLLSTRLNMRDNRIHAGVDGAYLLEELAAHSLGNYLGPTRSRSLVFGTAIEGDFPSRVRNLCEQIGEGGGFENIDEGTTYAKDDKLDVVAWIPFTDGKPGKLIIFAQCKTGSTWDQQFTQLQPEAFIKRWTRDRCYLVNPVRALCISEAADRSRWNGTSVYAGLMFDRCRIIDFSTDLDTDLLEKIRKWNKAVKESLD